MANISNYESDFTNTHFKFIPKNRESCKLLFISKPCGPAWPSLNNKNTQVQISLKKDEETGKIAHEDLPF